MRNWLFTTEAKKYEYYNGLLIHADTYLHEQALNLVKKYIPKGYTIIDIGAGAGAFSQRLADNGYIVTGTDISADEWTLTTIPFIQLDINKGIRQSISQEFDAICCLEVIEHVENPWALMRDINAIVKPGGIIVISTPNITSFLSRLHFLIRGKFHNFSDESLVYGHISPISAFHLSNIANNIGWEMMEILPGGYLPIFDFVDLTPKKLAINMLRGMAYIVAQGYKNGWCLFFVMRKNK
jgi:SAM-dependent methyltransferase